jgi:DNA polymerase-3 subunit delta
MTGHIHAFDFLAKPSAEPVAPVCVVVGQETFLRRLVLGELQSLLIGEAEEGFAAEYDGSKIDWRDCYDELATVSLFGGGGTRLVVVDPADAFVTHNRERLEDYVSAAKKNSVLVLTVDSMPSNTRLYKAVAKAGMLIECRAPERAAGNKKVLDEGKLTKWLVSWAKKQHRVKLTPEAAAWLVETVGPQLGLLDQDIAKLALFVEAEEPITFKLAQEAIGGWKEMTTWELMDAIADGNAAEALRQLDRILQAGEHPVALYGQMAWSLRRFAAATRIYQRTVRQRQSITIRDALLAAGFRQWPKDALSKAERQLKQLGSQRAAGLHRLLLDLDLQLKGSHSHPARSRFALEQLLLRLSDASR